MKKQLNYTIIDMRSFCHAYQFESKNENLFSFLDMINENITSDKILFIFTKNDNEYREHKYNELGFEYIINEIDYENTIKSDLFKYLYENKLNWRIVDSSGYESKDIIFSSINSMFNFTKEKQDKYFLNVNLITTNKNMVISKFLFEDSNFFHLEFNRYVKSKDFNGFEEIIDINKYLSIQYGLNLSNQIKNIKNKSSLDIYNYYQKIINDISVLTGIKNTKKQIKLVSGIGEKSASKFIDNYISLNHFLEIYDIDTNDKDINKFKKLIKKEELEQLIKISKINNINLDIDKEYIFKLLK